MQPGILARRQAEEKKAAGEPRVPEVLRHGEHQEECRDQGFEVRVERDRDRKRAERESDRCERSKPRRGATLQAEAFDQQPENWERQQPMTEPDECREELWHRQRQQPADCGSKPEQGRNMSGEIAPAAHAEWLCQSRIAVPKQGSEQPRIEHEAALQIKMKQYQALEGCEGQSNCQRRCRGSI